MKSFFFASSAIVAFMTLLPAAYLLFRAADGGGEALALLFRWRTWEIIQRSLVLTVAVTFFSMLISVPLAWLLVRTDLPMKRMWTALTTVPLVVPSYVGGFVLVAALGPKGMLQQFLAPLGVERLPEIYGLAGAALTLTLLRFPFMLIPIRASLSNLDPSLEESSQSLGMRRIKTFIRVVMPQLKPAVASGCLFTALAALTDFGAVSLLRYETFTWAIYLQYQSAFDRTGAAALSAALIVIGSIFLLLEGRTRKSAAHYGANHGRRAPLSPVRLGGWRIPALLFCGALAFASLVMPACILIYWLLRGLASGEYFPGIWADTANSLLIASAAAFITLIAAFPIAYISCRYSGRMVTLMERAAYIGFALPGIVVALALVFFGVRYLTPLYQTHALLIAAYVILFIPAAAGALRAVLLQMNTRLEEAAYSLGRSKFAALTRVTLPLTRPGIAGGWAMVFLLTMRELPATLILSPIGFGTLAASIWSSASEAFFARSAAYSLILIAAASIPSIFIAIAERRQSGA
ncbi:MAG: ABC transporter permease [Deltaproteobacteria bacterium]